LPIGDCSVLAGCRGAVLVAPGGFAQSLRSVPASGTMLHALPSRRWWLIQDGTRRSATSNSIAVDCRGCRD
jgi:hypothetical protein